MDAQLLKEGFLIIVSVVVVAVVSLQLTENRATIEQKRSRENRGMRCASNKQAEETRKEERNLIFPKSRWGSVLFHCVVNASPPRF
jgi:hypothetical protein